jgi:hypothetical protein
VNEKSIVPNELVTSDSFLHVDLNKGYSDIYIEYH